MHMYFVVNASLLHCVFLSRFTEWVTGNNNRGADFQLWTLCMMACRLGMHKTYQRSTPPTFFSFLPKLVWPSTQFNDWVNRSLGRAFLRSKCSLLLGNGLRTPSHLFFFLFRSGHNVRLDGRSGRSRSDPASSHGGLGQWIPSLTEERLCKRLLVLQSATAELTDELNG